MDNSIWSSIECDAWSRDFDYKNYLLLYTQLTSEESKISEKTYSLICKAFENQFDEDQILDEEE